MMFRYFRIIFFSLSLSAFESGPSTASEIDPTVIVVAPNPAEGSKENAQMRLARQLMASQDYQSAADILEVLYESDPTNTIVSNTLKSCYEHLKQYAKGELLLLRLSQQFPENISYKINLAENLVHQGKLDEGKELYNSLVANFVTTNSAIFTSVVRSMIDCDLDDEALVIIDKMRVQTGDPHLVAVERAGLLKQKREYFGAALEYFGVLKDTVHIGNTAEKGLQDLLDFEESSAPTEKALLSKISADSTGRALKVLSAYYLKTGRYDDAFQFAVRQDSAAGFLGSSLIQYLRGCMERQLYHQAIRMSQYVITNFKDKPFAGEFYYRYAESLEALGRYVQAIKVLDTIFATFPQQRDQCEAVYRIGRIYLDKLDSPQTALKYFDSVIAHYPVGFAYNGAAISIPRAYLQMGDLSRSRQAYEALARTQHSPDVSEEISFNLALLDLFEHNYDSCSLALKKLMVDFTQGYYVNDAVQLSFVINQAGDAQDLLDNFAGAILFQKMKLYDSTVARLSSIADAENKALADIALFRLTEIVLKRGDSLGAVKYVERMEAEHAESYYLPYGLKIKADILLTKPESASLSKEIYRRLLENYPNYPFINEVREKLRKLESGPKPS